MMRNRMNCVVELSLRWLLHTSLQLLRRQSKLQNHIQSKSDLLTKVADVATAVRAVKTLYVAGNLQNGAGRVATPYLTMGAVL